MKDYRPPSIFINYRREKTRDKALILRIILEAYFGEGSVFLDEESITIGKKWKDFIKIALEYSEVMIALIHKDWLKDSDERGYNRLREDPEDWVRLEIGNAKSRIPIIPILIDDAEIPEDEWLPGQIQGLFHEQGIRLNFNDLSRKTLEKLITGLTIHVHRWRYRYNASHSNTGYSTFYQEILDKTFPLPQNILDNLPERNSPYLGLESFKKQDARLFFGRSREIYSICYKIIHDQEKRLLFLDGYSGTGKSSLLQAGLIPRIEAQSWGVAYGRREQDKINGLNGILNRLMSNLYNKQEDITQNNLLILDQIEEAITNPNKNDPGELDRLFQELAVILQRRKNLKIILGFRSEYTAHIRQKINKYIQDFDADNTLYPLDRSGIIEAIDGVAKKPKLQEKYKLYFIPEHLPKGIAEQLLNSQTGYHIAPFLQVNMDLLWQQCRQPDGTVQITNDDIKNFIDTREALLEYYLNKIRSTIPEDFADDRQILEVLSFYIEEKPVSAVRLDKEFFSNEKFRSDEKATRLRDELKKAYLLTSFNHGKQQITRLTHDILAEVIHKHYIKLSEKQLRKSQYENSKLEAKLKRIEADRYPLIGESDVIKKIKIFLEAIAQKPEVNVLIQGETGVGKEVAARYLHRMGVRKDKPFVGVNLSAIQKSLLESTLFGVRKGGFGFTGATHDINGYFEQANGGILMLDEIGDIDKDLQIKLLRFLATRLIRPIGSDKDIEVDVQIVAATHQDLSKAVADGYFRQDLYQRLKVMVIDIPPLRARKEDISLIIESQLQKEGLSNEVITSETMEKLEQYEWPGNIRELVNTVNYMMLRRDILKLPFISLECLPLDIINYAPIKDKNQPDPNSGVNVFSVQEQKVYVDLSSIEKALQQTNGSKQDTAKMLQYRNSDNLRYRIKQYYQEYPHLFKHFPTIRINYSKLIE